MSTTLKDKVTKIALAFSDFAAKFNEDTPPIPEPTPDPIPAKLATDYKTLDGQTVLSIYALEVGGHVMIGETAAPDGEYTLEDKTIVQVAGGKIVELSSPMEDTMPEKMKKLQDTVTKMSSQIASLETQLATQKQNFSTSIANNKELMELVVELSEKSIVAPVEKQVPFEEMTTLQKRRLIKQQN
mgnify:CR=1 FL=1